MNTYDQEVPDYCELMTKEDWIACCDCGGYVDYDGIGYLVKVVDDEARMSNTPIFPSIRNQIPEDCTHVAWFNR